MEPEMGQRREFERNWNTAEAEAEARRLKSGRWRIYLSGQVARDATGAITSFGSLDQARRWWGEQHPDDPPVDEAPRCARCQGYFGATAPAIRLGDLWYHARHVPEAPVSPARQRL
jgi:hypothetical protein